MDWQAFWLTMRLSSATTLILALAGLPLAYWLANTRWPGRSLIEAVITLPLVLPPTVLGYYLLVAMRPESVVGQFSEQLIGGRLPFTFTGILIGSVLFNLPFAVRPFVAAFATMDRRLIETSWCLGVSRFETFRRITLPLCWPGIMAGLVLTFAHSLGEFGVVLMLGGNLAGKTRTLSISIYDDLQSLDYASAGRTSALLLLISLVALSIAQWLGHRGKMA